MKKVWTAVGNQYHLTEVSTQHEKLPVGVYRLNDDPKIGLYLTHVQDSFSFSYKIYGMETKFIDKVVNQYHNSKNNLGILMNGVKGSGKTVTAQIICNRLNLPTIIVPEKYDLTSQFINDVQQDIILFFDEYEKMYSNYDSSILTVMDGVLNTGYRRVFLLTSNSMYVNDNLLQRPSRIRYVKIFDDLKLDVIMEIVDDLLVYKNYRDELIEYISKLEIITVDIVKSIVEEVNVHNEPPSSFKNIFNVSSSDNVVNVFEIREKGEKVLRYELVKSSHDVLTSEHLGQDYYINDKFTGEIKTVVGGQFTILDGDDKYLTLQQVKAEKKHKNFIF